MDDEDVVFVDGADLDIEFFGKRDVEMGGRVKSASERIDLTVGGAGKFSREPVAFDNDVDVFGLVDGECDPHKKSVPSMSVLRRNIRVGFADRVDGGWVFQRRQIARVFAEIG